MEVRIKGQMTIADIRQALFEQLHELETKYAVQFSRGATLYINPTNGFGEDVTPRLPGGHELRTLYSRGRTAAQQMRRSFELGAIIMIKQPQYIGLEEARQVLAQMGVQLSLRQMQRAAEQDAQGRRKLPFFIDPIERKLKIEKSDLLSIYFKRQVEAQRNLRPE
jgi:hypothetical protein